MEIQQELIDRCLKGDRKAEYELYKILYSFLMSICRRYIRQDEKAREILNIGFCRMLMNINKYQPIAPFQYWARRIMVNVLINEHKRIRYIMAITIMLNRIMKTQNILNSTMPLKNLI